MKTTLTKKFHFSASFSREGKVIGHNYTLGVVTAGLDEPQEKLLERTVKSSLIDQLDSRDLGSDVGFLKNLEPDEQNFLKVFWDILDEKLRPISLESLFLEKDSRSRLTLSKAS